MVAIAQATGASASANTIAPNAPAGTAAGMNDKGKSQLSTSPASTALAHAIGGRIMTFAVSAALAIAGLLNRAPLGGSEDYSPTSISGKLLLGSLCHLNAYR